MFGLLGFLPCFILAKILKSFGLLRIPLEVEVAGLDHPVHKEEADQVRELIAAEREEFRAASR